MRKNRLFTTICLMAAILFTACTQDELAEQGNTLPEGEYPLQIGSVSITAEASEEPWTRVTEKPDGSGSVFQNGDRIGVRIAGSDETGIYVINVDADGNITSITPDKPVYWKNTQTADVTAWYPADRSSVDLGFQLLNNTMTYVLHGTGTGNHQSPVTLKFTHQLAKVRVVAKGTAEVGNIFIRNVPLTCYIEEGKITGQDNIITGIIQMLPVDHDGIGACWEASVGPDVEIKYFNINLMDCELTSPVTTQAGALHTITITANSEGTQTIDLSNSDYEINDDRTYYFSGTASHAIRVTGGNPEIYLEDAQINVSNGNAIDITGGASPTIHVMGEGNSVSSSYGAGIYVAENSTVTITGRDRNDVLTAQAGGNAAGIGGCSNNQDCGSINISNVTVIARGSQLSAISPGIGSTSTNQCGQITIDNATVHAYGKGVSNTAECPAIGTGIATSGAYGTTLPTVIIRNGAEVHAHRGGGSADYIGYPFVPGSSTGAASAINPGAGGSITGSTVYKYTYNVATGSSSGEGTVVYDASGNATGQSQ